ncbi:hypothetical protein [Chenggangzhangella methanolivorans]|nr:hypothetical protein [Chenggangzhangella methanolivorans]
MTGERVVAAGASRVAEGARLDVSEAPRAEAPAAANGAPKTGAP